ncbi:stabilin-2-like [Lingula anatina]|uniref:Stabilin-2-like n=1 Tax=Lingula anatina TaxID=7574 RepID=A0A1S3IZ81_LINAN|nr:stabilin-2-like [Lingula anatina]|eukprot:XP_013403296.2 stabilin-2-like [Lingula anatina]
MAKTLAHNWSFRPRSYNSSCTCIEGTCHNTIDGDGKCKPGSCQFSYTGDNCDKTWKVCPAFDKKLLHCHVHAHCEIDRPRRQPLGGLLPLLSLLPLGPRPRYMCSCNTGYTGNGRECFPIDPCALPDRGGCHPQAKCIQTGPGKSVCVCDPGWHGDGKSCSPIAVCTVHNDCHPDARCVLLIPGQRVISS